MNRTQRSSLLALSGLLMDVVFISYLLVTILVLKSLPNRVTMAVLLLLFGVSFAWGIRLLRRKQSPAEPEADERDKAIMRNAVLVSFISTWGLLAIATLIPALVLGQAGAVPVYILTFINLGVALMAGLIYCAAVLVQYVLGGKNGQ